MISRIDSSNPAIVRATLPSFRRLRDALLRLLAPKPDMAALSAHSRRDIGLGPDWQAPAARGSLIDLLPPHQVLFGHRTQR